MTTPDVNHAIDAFGEYGGLAGLLCFGILLYLFFVRIYEMRRQNRIDAEQTRTQTEISTAIHNHTIVLERLIQTIETGPCFKCNGTEHIERGGE